MNSKIYLRIYMLNGIVTLLLIILNVIVHLPVVITVDYVDGEQVVRAVKKYGEYFPLISILSIVIICVVLLASLFYMVREHKKLSKRLDKFISSFERSDEDLIELDEKLFKDNELAIINVWNENIKELNEINARRDDYFKRMIHDFKAPLHVIKANIQLFNLDRKEEDEYISIVSEEVGILEKDIENFLVLEKIDYFEKKHSTKVDIIELIKPIQSAYQEKGMTFELVKSSDEKFIYADRIMLRKIVENLVENAYKYSADCGIKIDVRDTQLIFENKIDLGQELGDIFSINTRSYSKSGNGLGVSIIKKYVEINNFRIMSKTKGDSFIVVLDTI